MRTTLKTILGVREGHWKVTIRQSLWLPIDVL